jgi:hypothetical protein
VIRSSGANGMDTCLFDVDVGAGDSKYSVSSADVALDFVSSVCAYVAEPESVLIENSRTICWALARRFRSEGLIRSFRKVVTT